MDDLKFEEVRRVVLAAELRALMRQMTRSATTSDTVEALARLEFNDMTFEQLRLLRDEVERVVRALGGSRQG